MLRRLLFLRLPRGVTESGTYYIKATNATGCHQIKPVKVVVNKVNLTTTDPPPACAPESVDLTMANVTDNS